MEGSDKLFKVACDKYYNNIVNLLKKGNIKQANMIIANIQESLGQWEKQIKLAKKRINMLRSLLIKISKNR